MAAKHPTPPAPAAAPSVPATSVPGDRPSTGDVWAFRAYAVLFLLTLLIGLLNFLGMKYLK